MCCYLAVITLQLNFIFRRHHNLYMESVSSGHYRSTKSFTFSFQIEGLLDLKVEVNVAADKTVFNQQPNFSLTKFFNWPKFSSTQSFIDQIFNQPNFNRPSLSWSKIFIDLAFYRPNLSLTKFFIDAVYHRPSFWLTKFFINQVFCRPNFSST